MKEVKIQTLVKVYPELSELSAQDQDLFAEARAALQNSYSPYSRFRVSAAILMANGQILTGTNQENAAYPMCMCAERTALSVAASLYPEEKIDSIAITARSEKIVLSKPIPPCGACRQVLCETESKLKGDIRVLLQGETGDIYEFRTAKDLLPLSFDGGFLD